LNQPVLRSKPDVWAKLHYFCHRGQTEIGGFGVTSAEDLLQVEEFVTVKQKASMASVNFDDESVADYFDEQIDKGRKPEQFGRLWLHTHPGCDPTLSSVDEETFARVFGKCEWAVMCVLDRGGKTFARLRFNTGAVGVDKPLYSLGRLTGGYPCPDNYLFPVVANSGPG